MAYGSQNEDAITMLQCGQMYDESTTSRSSKKNAQELITYRNGDNISTIDYSMVKRDHVKSIDDCKVIPEESVSHYSTNGQRWKECHD